MQELHASERWQLSDGLGYLEHHISELSNLHIYLIFQKPK